MFKAATAFNKPLDFWNAGAFTNMRSMFMAAPAFNHTIDSWNTEGVTNMSYNSYMRCVAKLCLCEFRLGDISNRFPR